MNIRTVPFVKHERLLLKDARCGTVVAYQSGNLAYVKVDNGEVEVIDLGSDVRSLGEMAPS